MHFTISWKLAAGKEGGSRGEHKHLGRVRFSFASEQRNEGCCSNNPEEAVQMHELEAAARVTSHSTFPQSGRGKGTYYRKRQ